MNRVVHFEIHANNVDRAAKFYTDLFGWTFQKWEGSPNDYRMIFTQDPSLKAGEGAPGINGGLFKRMGSAPIDGQAVNAYVCTVEVEDLDACVTKATSTGGSLALPKQPIPGMGYLAYCKDTEGNIFGMMQNDPTAKMA